MEDEKFIFEHIKQGNHKAYKKLFDRYYYALKGFSRKFVTRNDICDDMVQKAFVSLWEHAKELKSAGTIKSYLYSSVRNGCLNYVKRERGRHVNEEAFEILSSNRFYEESVIEEEVYSEVYLAIKNLPPQSRRVIILSMNGLKNDEIAEDLEISVNTVKTLKKKAYQRLREELKGSSWIIFLSMV